MAKLNKSEIAALMVVADEAKARLPGLVFAEGTSRVAVLECLTAAMGPKPSDARKEELRLLYCSARMASTIPSNRSMEDRIADNALLITKYVAPGSKVGDDKMGARSVEQDKAYVAARGWWSKALADIGMGSAQTTKAKNDKQAAKAKAEGTKPDGAREPHHNNGGPNADKGAPEVPNLKAEKITAESAARHLELQAASLLAYINKAQADTKGGINILLVNAVADFKAAIDKATA